MLCLLKEMLVLWVTLELTSPSCLLELLTAQRTTSFITKVCNERKFKIIAARIMLFHAVCIIPAGIIILANTRSAELLVTVRDDTIPEIDETFFVSLESVELSADINGGRDFDFAGNPETIDEQPKLGSVTQFSVTILENDDPYGVVSFTTATLMVTEGDTASLTLSRTGGNFGIVVLTVTVTSGVAQSSDYNDITGSLVTFSPGQTTAELSLSITDDTVPELQEDFSVSVSLSSISSAASLGSISSVTVIIDASDSPNGVLGFQTLQFTRENPTTSPSTLALSVERVGGSIGQTQVCIS